MPNLGVGALVVAAALLTPALAHADVAVLSAGNRFVGASAAQDNRTQWTQLGEFDGAQSASWPLSDSGLYQGSSSARVTSYSGQSGARAAVTVSADCVNPYDTDGGFAQQSAFIFRLTSATTLNLIGSVALQGDYSGFGSGASVAVSGGSWNGTSFNASGAVFIKAWSPLSASQTWTPNSSFNEIITLPPGDYELDWFAGLGEGSPNPLVGATGAGTLQFYAALAFTGSAGCVTIQTQTPAQVVLGNTIQLAGDCCSGATAVPAQPSPWLLALLLLTLGAALLSRRRIAALPLAAFLLLGEVPVANGQSCSLTWEARSPFEVFTGAGSQFSFTPSVPGKFQITLTSGTGSAVRTINVVQPPCNSGADCDDGNPCTTDTCTTTCVHSNNTAACEDGNPCTLNDQCGGGQCFSGSIAPNGGSCGTASKCQGGICMGFDLYGTCCGTQIKKASDLSITVATGQTADPGSCEQIAQSRTVANGDCGDPTWASQTSPCTGQPTLCSGLPASGQSTRVDCRIGSRASDNPLNGTNNDDRIFGFASDDAINGMMGADLIYGDTGADTIHGGQGNDCIHGGKDGDTVFGDIGNDTLFGDRGDDTLQGGDGDDTYVFNAANPGSERCNSNGTITCEAPTANDGTDTITGETPTSGTDTVFIENAGPADVCLARDNDDLVVRICIGSPTGSVRLPSYFTGQNVSGTNKIERISLTGN